MMRSLSRVGAKVLALSGMVVLLVAGFGLQPSRAQKSAAASPGLRTVEFDTDEGTYMCVDVSPDGKLLVLDLLGDLYTLPIAGGAAKPLLSGRAWDRCPRYSPDGKDVAFISDRGNIDNVWTINLASRKLRQVTDLSPVEESVLEGTDGGVSGVPMWHPDGRHIAYMTGESNWARKIFTVPATGGKPRVLVDKTNDNDGVISPPAFTPDGKAIYSDRNVNKTQSGADGMGRRIQRVSLDSGVMQQVKTVQGRLTRLGGDSGWYSGGDLKPVLSKSGRYLAYIHTNEPSILELRVRDLKSGADRRLLALPDAAGVWKGSRYFDGGYAAYAITPDEKDVVIWSKGKLFRVSVETADARLIPFTVHVSREIADPSSARYRIADGDIKVRAIRWPLLMPDEKSLVFSAVGYLWSMSLPNGAPQRLTQSNTLEFMPALSPDGKRLAYVECPNEDKLHCRLMTLHLHSREAAPITAASESGSYWLPRWSPDGTKIAVLREPERRIGKSSYGWVDAASGEYHKVVETAGLSEGIQEQAFVKPQYVAFSPEGDRLVYVDAIPDKYKRSLRSIALDGSGMRELLKVEADVTAIIPSPDMTKAILLGWDYQAYLISLKASGATVQQASVFDSEKKKDLSQISTGGALHPRWIDSQTLTYGWTTAVFKHRLDGRSTPLAKVDLTVPRRVGKDVFALRNARLITIDGESGAGTVIDNGTLVVRGARIVALGPVDSTAVPADAQIIDATGLTIMPGMIDAHAHGFGRNGLKPERNLNRGLAYGFTTAWEAASDVADDTSLAIMELMQSGRIPDSNRWFASTGIMNNIDLRAAASGVHFRTFEEVRNQVQRRVELGAEQCVKHKNGGMYRQVTQWMAQAAHEAGICAVAHVQPNWIQLMSRVTDGFHVDHPGLIAPSYRDVLELLHRSGAVWTPHFHMGSNSWTSDIKHGDEDLWQRFMLERMGSDLDVEIKLRGFPIQQAQIPSSIMIPIEASEPMRTARVVTSVVANGGKIAGGSTDGGQDMENHYELWTFRQTGMPPGDALRTATMFPAQKLGIDRDVGSLEIGKIADMIILDGNPLERIENTLRIKYTVFAGIIYQRDPLKAVSPASIPASGGKDRQ